MVDVERRGSVAWVRVHNGEVDLMDPGVLADLRRVLVGLVRDGWARVVVLAGLPGRFPIMFDPEAGQRIAARVPPIPGWLGAWGIRGGARLLRGAPRLGGWILDRLGDEAALYGNLLMCAEILEHADAISVAAIDGPAFGGGMELALCCDLRYCSDRSDTWLAQPEVLASIMPGFGATQRLPRIVGVPRALELLLLCEAIDPETAARIGLVNRVLPADRFEATVGDLTQRLASRSRAAAVGTKRAVRAGMGRLSMAREVGEVIPVWRGSDARPGLARVSRILDGVLQGPEARPALPELLSRLDGSDEGP